VTWPRTCCCVECTLIRSTASDGTKIWPNGKHSSHFGFRALP
jgi:hypothetical protein